MRYNRSQRLIIKGFGSLVQRFRVLACMLMAVVWMTVQSNPLPGQENKDDSIDFERQVKPIFTKHCTACHGGVMQAADLSFVHGEGLEGTIIEPGDPDASLLVERILSDDPEERMPPPEHGPALSETEVEVLKNWIQKGAKWEKHWSFRPPTAIQIPKTKNQRWARQSIDHFVLEKLEANQIKPAKEAQPERWLRRVTLDLIGLPPTLEERKVFLERLSKARTNDAKENAYADVVDRLLKSSSFGERWASVWLDQVRYADSKGLGLDGPRNIWKYRDWVIRSFNEDLPFDQFTIKQIAGDLLPDAGIDDYIATAAHRLTQTNEEGGTDDEEFRIAAVLDRTNTTWQAWQGITFGCVQCHSHPYDPIEHEEYYKFAAFFNNTADSDLGEDWPTIAAPLSNEDYEKAARIDQKISALRKDLWQEQFRLASRNDLFRPLSGLSATTNNKTKVEVINKNGIEEFRTVDTVSRNTDITLTTGIPSGTKKITAIQLIAKPLQPKTAIKDSEWGFVLSHFEASLLRPGKQPEKIRIAEVIGDEPDPFRNPQESLDPKSSSGFSAYTRIYRDRVATFVLAEPIENLEGSTLEVVLRHRMSALGAFPLIIKCGSLAFSESDELSNLTSNRSLQTKVDEIKKLMAERGKIKSTNIPIFRERPEHLARSQQVFIRGLYLTKGATVTADTPAALSTLPDDSSKDRLALAQWMVSPDNPLTARVAVNRIWARIFGNGIVATEEDFGSSGELPSHPKLLDYLARKFQSEFGWSQKRLVRELVLSSTYRQHSATRPELIDIDSANRLLARGPKNRLASEVVRDQALSLAGLLSEKMYGPPVRPPLPDGVWKPFAGWDKWDTPGPDSEDRYRRAIYTYTKRSIPYPMFAAFDAPSREVCTPRRLQSNTPIQALMNLNDQTMIECAAAFGKRMKNSPGDTQAKIKSGFLMATCREPDPGELQPLLNLIKAYPADEKDAGWNAVASVILNLDEVLTK